MAAEGTQITFSGGEHITVDEAPTEVAKLATDAYTNGRPFFVAHTSGREVSIFFGDVSRFQELPAGPS